jgi:hypothetical protein
MLHHLDSLMTRLDSRSDACGEPAGGHLTVAIRRALDADVPLLDDLAELDSAMPLEGAVLVAVVEGAIWAAAGLDDGRVIADPFLPTGPAVELLALRVRQLRAAAAGAPRRRLLPRRTTRRARA